MNDDVPPGNVTPISHIEKKTNPGRTRQRAASGRRTPERVIIPTLPADGINLAQLKANADTPGKRAWAAFAMRKRMIPFEEIAEFLDYDTPGHAASAVYGIVAATAPTSPEGMETLRGTIIAGLEDQLRRSITMASANEFVDAEGNRYPNHDRIAWHAEARRDYEILARVSGAQAAAQIQLISPEAAELDQIVRAIEARQGRSIVEADVVDVEVIEG
jgi:hypothetical protein